MFFNWFSSLNSGWCGYKGLGRGGCLGGEEGDKVWILEEV